MAVLQAYLGTGEGPNRKGNEEISATLIDYAIAQSEAILRGSAKMLKANASNFFLRAI